MPLPVEPACSQTRLSFPNDPFFLKLVENAKTYPHRIIDDATLDIQADYRKLMQDVVTLRETIRHHLPHNLLDPNGLIREDGVYIGVLAPGSYEYVVAIVAIVALGAAVIPFSTGILPEEGFDMISRWKPTCLLVGSGQLSLATAIQEYDEGTAHIDSVIPHIPIHSSLSSTTQLSVDELTINDSITFSSERPALLLFTSGTTGAPKGVIHTRRFFYSGQGFAERCFSTDVFLLHRPVAWIGSMRRIIEMLRCGGKIAIMDQTTSSRSDVVWERIRKGDITILTTAAREWRQLMLYYENSLSKLPEDELSEYWRGLRALRVVQSVGWMPPPVVKAFWEGLLDGRALEVAYASTEAGTVVASTSSDVVDHDACIGKPLPEMEIKLSNGTEGEILVKTPTMFAGYLNDEDWTQKAFDQGYFRSGDMAYIRDDGCYIIGGRAKTDFARFFGLAIPLIEVESAVAQLPYVDEAHILAVPDSEAQTRVGALIRLKSGFENLALEALRKNLSSNLPMYKLPTLLYVLQDHEQVPKTVSGKLCIKDALRVFFACSASHWTTELPEKVEKWDISTLKKERQRAWDWSGLQV
ncbi:acetyl-CoA synthetase-like protein [Aspergillus steynii IBT 23096]|uniref:Acetyl-CoA synthetase-like protein n=1 Tax=Aspergillus steynii IBT 23096 TaxID=1392250 RepID=A0A2I2GLX5_9EURO|nr:acetyl-CoA synthetase-like protein [Aspergillus steynii IBT 23096]PLB53873.1 acetyl-CoA synthetase-like protein [Aspergillus steynii IBT 23096]